MPVVEAASDAGNLTPTGINLDVPVAEDPNPSDWTTTCEVALPEGAHYPRLGVGTLPAVQRGARLEWLAAGPLEIPNPGWKFQEIKDVTAFLQSPNKKAVLLFTEFDKPQNAHKKVYTILEAAKLRDFKWRKPKIVSVGPDEVPAAVVLGLGKGADGKGAMVFYALLKTGGEKDLLAVGTADDGAKDDLKIALAILDSIKTKKK